MLLYVCTVQYQTTVLFFSPCGEFSDVHLPVFESLMTATTVHNTVMYSHVPRHLLLLLFWTQSNLDPRHRSVHPCHPPRLPRASTAVQIRYLYSTVQDSTVHSYSMMLGRKVSQIVNPLVWEKMQSQRRSRHGQEEKEDVLLFWFWLEDA